MPQNNPIIECCARLCCWLRLAEAFLLKHHQKFKDYICIYIYIHFNWTGQNLRVFRSRHPDRSCPSLHNPSTVPTARAATLLWPREGGRHSRNTIDYMQWPDIAREIGALKVCSSEPLWGNDHTNKPTFVVVVVVCVM